MTLDDNLYFHMFPCCEIVNGAEKDAIYDLQREVYKLIPHSMSEIISKSGDMNIGELKKAYPGNEEFIDQYVNFLIENEFCVLDTKKETIFYEINKEYRNPKTITNAILDYDSNVSYSLENAIRQLSDLRCENIELRLYNVFPQEDIECMLNYFKDTAVRDVELLIQYEDTINVESLKQIRYSHARVRKITVSNSPQSLAGIYEHEELYIIFSCETVIDETSCGVIGPWYLLPKTELFVESMHYNSCLNRKISVDRHGFIKNCPSMRKSFGHIDSVMMRDVVELQEFRKLWMIKKDDIDTCNQCELRHMCQDCRAYIQYENNPYSKPKKCSYNPLKK